MQIGRTLAQFSSLLCDELNRRIHDFPYVQPKYTDPHLDYGLFLIQWDLAELDRTLDAFGLPHVAVSWDHAVGNALIDQELQDHVEVKYRSAQDQNEGLNADRRHCFDTVVASVEQYSKHAHLFFRDRQGGANSPYTRHCVITFALTGKWFCALPLLV